MLLRLSRVPVVLSLVCGSLVVAANLAAADDASKLQARVDRWVEVAKQCAADPVIVAAVAAQNQQVPASFQAMRQEKWTGLLDTDPFVRRLMLNPAAQALRARRVDGVAQMFVSDANGIKVAYLTKPTYWSHKGNPKHDQPMAGQVWQGKLELERTVGARMLQIGVPVLQEGKPIGSLVLGIAVGGLTGG
jgi:hypothetical protein